MNLSTSTMGKGLTESQESSTLSQTTLADIVLT